MSMVNFVSFILDILAIIVAYRLGMDKGRAKERNKWLSDMYKVYIGRMKIVMNSVDIGEGVSAFKVMIRATSPEDSASSDK